MEGRCRDCRWWDRDYAQSHYDAERDLRHGKHTNAKMADCRAGGPRVSGGYAHWPKTMDRHWCRGFEPMSWAQRDDATIHELKKQVLRLFDRFTD